MSQDSEGGDIARDVETSPHQSNDHPFGADSAGQCAAFGAQPLPQGGARPGAIAGCSAGDQLDQVRADLVGELHDQFGQTFAALKYEIDAVSAREPVVAGRMHLIVLEAMTALRDVSHNLRPAGLHQGLAAALRALARDVTLRSNLDVVAEVSENLTGMSGAEVHALYRIAQEALSNAASHSQGRNAVVRATRGVAGAFVLQVCDDGTGFDVEEAFDGAGLGLRGMRERAHRLAARLTVRRRPEGGTSIRLEREAFAACPTH